MSLGLSFGHTISTTIRLGLFHAVGDTIGDIPLISLHRVRSQLRRNPSDAIQGNVQNLLINALIRANRDYRTATGNQWNCLTANDLECALEEVRLGLEAAVQRMLARIVDLDDSESSKEVIRRLNGTVERNLAAIRSWFSDNAEAIRYDMSGKIPWAIVQRLQANLAIWAAGAENPFTQPIEELIVDVAASQGIETDDPGDAWIKMGGKLNTRSRT